MLFLTELALPCAGCHLESDPQLECFLASNFEEPMASLAAWQSFTGIPMVEMLRDYVGLSHLDAALVLDLCFTFSLVQSSVRALNQGFFSPLSTSPRTLIDATPWSSADEVIFLDSDAPVMNSSSADLPPAAAPAARKPP